MLFIFFFAGIKTSFLIARNKSCVRKKQNILSLSIKQLFLASEKVFCECPYHKAVHPIKTLFLHRRVRRRAATCEFSFEGNPTWNAWKRTLQNGAPARLPAPSTPTNASRCTDEFPNGGIHPPPSRERAGSGPSRVGAEPGPSRGRALRHHNKPKVAGWRGTAARHSSIASLQTAYDDAVP